MPLSYPVVVPFKFLSMDGQVVFVGYKVSDIVLFTVHASVMCFVLIVLVLTETGMLM